MTLFEVHGSYGILYVDVLTGMVVHRDHSSEYDDILRFDTDGFVEEFGRPIPEAVDILDIGFWTDDGEYQASQVDRHTGLHPSL